MRFHVVSVPFTHTTDEFSACAFTEKVRKFCIMMHNLGHEVYLYAGEENEAPCTEHICCMPEPVRQEFLGDRHYTQGDYNYLSSAKQFWSAFNRMVAIEISQRAQPHDFVCIISGLANKELVDLLPGMMCVEFGIGYPGSFLPYRVFESYAWMHATYSVQHGSNDCDGRFYDTVIPSYFEQERFDIQPEKDDYLLYVGRLTQRKGLQIAEDVARYTGRRLVVCGTGDLPVQDWWDYRGVVQWQERNKIMGKARCILVPTLYVEPFGSVAVEAMMCGTPAITTDWGAFTETVVQGETGFRCRTMKEFVEAVDRCSELSPYAIAGRARRLYALDAVAKRYDEYFKRLMSLWGAGFYDMGPMLDAAE